MTLRLNVEQLARLPGNQAVFQTVGKLRSVRGLLRATLPASVGELCRISGAGNELLTAEVVGFDVLGMEETVFQAQGGLFNWVS